MDKYLSEKLRIFSLFSMVLVVYIHGYTVSVGQFHEKSISTILQINLLLQSFVSNGIARIAVPLFFIISGFLIKRKLELSFKAYFVQLKKRLRTLLIPYLFWSAFGLMVYFLLQISPFTNRFFVNKLVVDFTFIEFLERLLLNPVPYQFWFVRDLMVLVLVSPIVILFVNKTKHFGMLLLLAMYFFSTPLFIIKFDSLLFFSLGCYLATLESKKFLTDTSSRILFLIWLVILMIKAYLENFTPISSELIEVVQKISMIIGLISTWYMYDIVFNKRIKPFQVFLIKKVCKFTFFIYAFHEPFLTMLKKIGTFLLGAGDVSMLIIYLICPPIIILVSIYVGVLLRKFVEKPYLVITGGR